ncbi:bifunctional folylpolyglutamate synthase/dihydrofolate synthase [Corynebacterium breve]
MTESGVTLTVGSPRDDETPADDLEVENVERIDIPVTDEDRAALSRVEAELNARASEREIDPSTEKISLLLDFLGTPQQTYKAIHVAGTNGKTSAVRMIGSLLGAFHRRVGYFVSPQLTSVTDTIGIDGESIHPADFVRIYHEISSFIELIDERYEVPLSKFEVLVAIAYAAFADAPVDVAVIETGMGGTWDATNVIDADVAVIMPVGLDHTDFLGETVAEIAEHKAGIIRNGDTVAIAAEQSPEAMNVVLRRAVEVGSTVARFGTEFGVKESMVAVGGQTLALQGLGGIYDGLFLPVSGEHQAKNAAVALAAVEAFFGARADHQLNQESVRRGFAAVDIPGRLERVSAAPTTFVDATHNPAGAQALAQALERDFNFTRLVGVVAILMDKDADGILRALEPQLSEVVITQNNSPRAYDAYELAEVARKIFGDERVHVEEHLPSAYNLAVELAGEDDAEAGTGVVFTGSVVTAGEARELFGKDTHE